MASSSAHADKHPAMEDTSPPISSSPMARVKRKAAATEAQHKLSQRSSKKKKFQSSLAQSEQFPVSKLLPPRYIDLDDQQLCSIFSRLIEILKFQGWVNFVSQYKVYYPRLVS